MKRVGIIAATLGLLALALTARAQSYSIDGYTVDSGGGTSTGGVYSVTGTIGQPDAGAMSGGHFTLEGGFWPGVIVPSSGEVPTLFIRTVGPSVQIGWEPDTAGFTLQITDSLGELNWATGSVGNPVLIPASEEARFFRLRKP